MRFLFFAAGLALVGVSAACSGNPMPGDENYPYNLSGEYDVSIDAMGAEYAGPAKLTTSPGGLVYGVLDLQGPERVAGNIEGEISGDTLTFDSNYERGGGCTGVLSGEGRITEGGGSVAGGSVVDDSCTGDLFDAAFKFTRKTE